MLVKLKYYAYIESLKKITKYWNFENSSKRE